MKTFKGYCITIEINKQKYRYFKSKDIEEQIKRIIIKRDTLDDIYFFIFFETNENKILERMPKHWDKKYLTMDLPNL